MNLTKVLLPTTVTLTVLLTVYSTGRTSTVTSESTTVAFSVELTLTTLVQLPVALDLATIQNSLTSPISNLSIVQLTF